jgi:CotS family spore coat protein
MGDIINSVLAYFGVESQNIVKEKGSYLCRTDRGMLKLEKTGETIEAINSAHALKEHAAKAGFKNTDRYITGPDGFPFAQFGVDRYLFTRMASGRELDFANPLQVITAVKMLACFHIAATGVEATFPASCSCEEIFCQGLEALSLAVKQTRRQKQLSDFDILLLKNAPAYEAQITQAINELSSTPYPTLYAQALEKNHLCHNALKEEYIFVDNDEAYLTHFTSATKDLQLCDLAAFIRRYALRGDASLSVHRLLEAYNKNNPLPNGSEAVLRAFLLYPAPFVKTVKQYYSKKRSWTPAGLILRMEAVLARQARYDLFLSKN